ncbi:MAG: carbonic anhydrase [Peptococcaceae bacterium]|nr:carbonic anhydrase [Peptococcaceae bacterium]
MIEEILAYNQQFVEEGGYEQFLTDKYPNKKLAIVTCMDTRLIELLPAALGIKNGDAKIIKNAGGVISSPFGSAMRSLLIAIYELGVEDIMVIGHTDCGVSHIDSNHMLQEMKKRGVNQQAIDLMRFCGVDFDRWLAGFETVEKSVAESVDIVVKHPLVPKDVRVSGYVMDSVTGALTLVCEHQAEK